MRKKVTEVVVAHNGRDARRLIIRRVIPFPWPYLLGLIGCLLCGVLVLSFAGYTLPLSPSPYTVRRTQILTAYGQSPDDPTWTIDVEGDENLRILSDSTVRLKISGAAATPGYVGIGTTTPAQLLHVAGNATVTGNLGVGTTSPSYKLDVAGTIRAQDVFSAGGQNLIIGDDIFLSDLDTANTLGIYGLQDSTVATIKLGSGGGTISGYSGRIGINTTTPAYTLDVNGNMTATVFYDRDNTTYYVNPSENSYLAGSVGIGVPPDSTKKLYAYRPSGDYGAGKAAVCGYRYGASGASYGGSGWGYSSIDAAVVGASYYGNNYTAGVAGFNYNDYGLSAGVFGADWTASYWGALAYKDSSGSTWGVYTPNNAYLGGSVYIGGTDLALGVSDSRAKGTATGQRALVHADWSPYSGSGTGDWLYVNFNGDFDNGVIMYPGYPSSGLYAPWIFGAVPGKVLVVASSTEHVIAAFYKDGPINWTNVDPAGKTDEYDICIYGWLKPASAEAYTFTIYHDDGAGFVFYDHKNRTFYYKYDTGTTAFSVTTGTLDPNQWYMFFINNEEETGTQSIRLTWKTATIAEADVPASNLAAPDASLFWFLIQNGGAN